MFGKEENVHLWCSLLVPAGVVFAIVVSVLVAPPVSAAARTVKSRVHILHLMLVRMHLVRSSPMFPRTMPTPVTSIVLPITRSPGAPPQIRSRLTIRRQVHQRDFDGSTHPSGECGF